MFDNFFCRLASIVSFWAISVQPKPIFGLGQGLKLINYWKMTIKIIICLSWNDPVFFLMVYQKKIAIEFQSDWENIRNYNNRQWNLVHIGLGLRCVLLKKSAIFKGYLNEVFSFIKLKVTEQFLICRIFSLLLHK